MMNALYFIALALFGITFENGQQPYFNVGKQFAEAHANMFIDPNKFGYNIAIRNGDSLWVCSTNSAIEFKDTFALYSFDTVMLSPQDFPQDTIINEQ